jgi:hypothetical protein
MPSPTIGAALHLTRTTAQGPQHALGTEVVIGGSTLEQVLYYITTSTGAVAGGPQFANTSSETAVTVPAKSGEQVWVYVFNDDGANGFLPGQAIYRLSSVTEAYFGGTRAPAGGTPLWANRIIGVAQHAIPGGSYGWILKRGVGKILSGTSDLTADTAFVSGGAGNVGSVKDATLGTDDGAVFGCSIALIDESVADTGLAWINCPG